MRIFSGVLLWAVFAVGAGSVHSGQRSWLEAETLAQRAEAQLLRPWKKAWLARRADDFCRLMDSQAVVRWDHRLEPGRDYDGVREFRWQPVAPMEGSARAPRAQFSEYLNAFSTLEHVELAIADLEVDPKGQTVLLTLDIDVRGRQLDGSRRNDRGRLEVAVSRAGRGFKVVSLGVKQGETLTSRGPVFEDYTVQSGLDRFPVAARAEALRRGGYALAVGDLDQDGLPEIYVGGSGPGKLFRNAGPGAAFREITGTAGLGRDAGVKAAAIADMDGDGRPDLLLQRFVDDPDQELVFYRNLGGGRFAHAPARVNRVSRHDRPMSMAVADVNGDGRLDLYVGYPGVRDFTDGWVDPDPNLRHEAVYLNGGGWRFDEVEDAIPGKLSEPDRPHGEVVLDINEDGLQDLVVVNDHGGASRAYLNTGDGRFSLATVEPPLSRGWGMTAVAGDFLSNGRQGLYFTNIDFSAGYRLQRFLSRDVGADPAGSELLLSLLQGNRLHRPRGMGAGAFSFEDITGRSGVGWAGEAPAGAEWLDYNNDGLLDLYVANGLWSADPDGDHASEFLVDLLRKPADGVKTPPNKVMKILQNRGLSFAGYQRNRLFRNNGDETFTEVGYLAGVDRTEDGYVVAVSDLDQDGRVDLILRNADPAGLRWSYPAVLVMRNISSQGGAMAAFSPKNPDGSAAFGTRLFLRANGRVQAREIRSVQGAVQSEPVAYFGLGAAERIESLEVLWPSGRRDRHVNLRPGRYALAGGEVLVDTALPSSPRQKGR